MPKEIETVLLSIVSAELSHLRRRYYYFQFSDLNSLFSEAPFFIDSMEFLYLASYVADYFGLYESGVEDVLLRYKTLKSWGELISDIGVKKINFKTSGSAGVPKTITHNLEKLKKEAFYLSSLFEGRKRVISLAYSHHIYGFIFTILLPSCMQADMFQAGILASRRLEKLILKDDLVVSTPFIYSNICKYEFNANAAFVASGSPLAKDIYDNLSRNSNKVWEIYGSTETAGIGVRSSFYEPFVLFSYLQNIESQIYDNGTKLFLQDKLEWIDDTHFYVNGRLDDIVQVGGVNVSIIALKKIIIDSFDTIKELAIRLDKESGRLKAAFVVSDKFDKSVFFEWQSLHLSSPQRLYDIKIVDSLPQKADGKAQDWNPTDKI